MATNLSVQGKVIQVLTRESGQSKQGKDWQKQGFILETVEQYPRKIAIYLWGEKVDQYPVSVGETLTAHINIESREFQGRWYTEVGAWRVEREGFDATAGTAQATPQAPQATPQEASPTAQPTQPIPSNTPTMPIGATMQVEQTDLPF